MPVSLRVSPAVTKRIARLALARDTSPHAFMLEAIHEKLEAEENELAFRAEAERRLAAMKKADRGISADAVFAYLEKRVRGRKAKRPLARKR